MMMLLISVIAGVLCTSVAYNPARAAWLEDYVVDLGGVPIDIVDLQVGAARNDDTLRVYAAWGGLAGGLGEFSHMEDSTWNYRLIDGLGVEGLVIGPGRNDEVMRIYTASDSTYEFSYEGGTWIKRAVGHGGHEAALGVGRNDDTVRVYTISGEDGCRLYEMTYANGQWRQEPVDCDSSPTILYQVAVGCGRNDGVARVYISSGRHVYEFSYDSGIWTEDSVTAVLVGSVRDINIGEGRNDGVMRIYVTATAGLLYELSYEDSLWNKELLGLNGGEVSIGKGRGDDTLRVYVADGYFVGNRLSEYTYSDTGWVCQEVGSVAPFDSAYFMESVAIGGGRNDGRMRVYGGSAGVPLLSKDGRTGPCVYEYTYRGTRVEESLSILRSPRLTVLVQNTPNPLRTSTTISYSLPINTQVHLSVYDSSGRLINTLVDQPQESGHYSIPWNGTDELGSKVASGIYFYRVQTEDYTATRKLVVVR